MRPLAYHACTRLVSALNATARKGGLRPVSRLDALQLSLAVGLGHGAAHAAFLGAGVLSLAASPGTLYADSCPQLSLTAATALCSLALSLLLTFAMVCSFHGLATRSVGYIALPPALHVAAALLSLSSTAAGGCVATVTLLLLAAAVAVAAAGGALAATLASGAA